VLVEAAAAEKLAHHDGGTYLCIEGPQFSTRAESMAYRALGADVIGMTNLPEAKLAREAELCYATLALVTDYDCWKVDEAPVSVDAVVENLRRNAESARRLIVRALSALGEIPACGCGDALATAILTPKERISDAARQRVGLLLGRYLDG
jgi:5'-methylthioadenosine phosphorylase